MDISFQLFSARNYPLADVLKKLSALGYTQVEGFGGLFADLPGLKAQLDANNLKMPSSHIGLDVLEKPDEGLKIAEALGIKLVVCPWLHPDLRPKDTAGWQKFGEKLGKTAEPYLNAGLTFGYHNHDFEFAKLPDGRYPMDVLLAAAPNVSIEADVAWIVRGKADPTAWLIANGPRIAAIHVKDLAAPGQNADEDGWADVGHGVLPWKDLMATARTKTAAKYFVAEHDNPSDIDRFASRSIAAIRSF
jgi:sugar phosphate isomerase/epimerase